MDNLASYKGAGVREAIEGIGATLLYLPPYSPDFNPIEEAFSKLASVIVAGATAGETAIEQRPFLGRRHADRSLGADACLTKADGHAEHVAALHMIEPRADRTKQITLGADKGYDSG